MNYSFAFSDW